MGGGRGEEVGVEREDEEAEGGCEVHCCGLRKKRKKEKQGRRKDVGKYPASFGWVRRSYLFGPCRSRNAAASSSPRLVPQVCAWP